MANITYETNPINIIINGFKRAFAHSQQLAIMLIVIPMALGVINFVAQIFSEVFSSAIDSSNDRTPAIVVVGFVLFILAMLLTMFAQVLYVGFQAFAAIKISRGEDETFGKALEQAFSKFWKIVGINIMIFIYALPYAFAIFSLVILNIVLGVQSRLSLAFSLPPSIILAIALGILMVRVYLRFAFSAYYLFDGNHSAATSLEKSRHLTRNRLSEVFGVMTISSMVPFVSSLCMTSGMAVLYKQLVEAREAKTELPRQHLLNYLVPFLGLVLMGILAFVGLAIYAAVNAA
jgi:hypothetical protein